ncbi:hypothetical protein ACLQ24_26540, partial [Micromonospora sp. DT4]
MGAHASEYDDTHIAAGFIGNDGDVTPAVLRSMRALYSRANALTGKTLAKTWHGGRSGNSTECPGSQLRAWVQAGMNSDNGPAVTDPPPSSGGLGGRTCSIVSPAAVASLRRPSKVSAARSGPCPRRTEAATPGARRESSIDQVRWKSRAQSLPLSRRERGWTSSPPPTTGGRQPVLTSNPKVPWLAGCVADFWLAEQGFH